MCLCQKFNPDDGSIASTTKLVTDVNDDLLATEYQALPFLDRPSTCQETAAHALQRLKRQASACTCLGTLVGHLPMKTCLYDPACDQRQGLVSSGCLLIIKATKVFNSFLKVFIGLQRGFMLRDGVEKHEAGSFATFLYPPEARPLAHSSW